MKRIASNFLLLVISLGLCLAIAEAISGFIIAHRTSADVVEARRDLAELREIGRIHPYYGYEHAATKTPIPMRRPLEGSKFHVVVSGGSVACQVVRYAGDHLRQALERKLNGQVELYRFCRGGFKQPQQLHALVQTVLQGRYPDIVINLDGFNEGVLPLAENLPSETPLDYPRRWNLGSLLYQKDSPVRNLWAKQVFYSYISRIAMAAVPYLPTNIGLLYKDALTNWENTRTNELAQEMEEIAQLAGWRGPLRKVAQRMGDQIDDAATEAIRVWLTSSELMATFCNAHGIQYFHFLQPNQNVAESKPLTVEEEKLVGKGLYGEFAARIYPKLIKAGRSLPQQGVKYVDLTSIFGDIKEQLYVDDCCHVNLKGSRILAQAMAEVVVLNNKDQQDANILGPFRVGTP